MNIKVLLISRLESTIDRIESLIEDESLTIIGTSPGGTAALETVDNLSPDIVIMTLGAGDNDVLSLTERIVQSKPRSHVILLTDYLDINTMQSSMKAGVHNVIQFPETAKEFGEYIKTVYRTETARIESLSGNQSLSWLSRVITVFGAKGGLGKTTIAINLAVLLAQKHKKVALVDLDLQFGDVNIFMDMDPTDTIFELTQEFIDPNVDLVRSYMTVHPSGVHVLCAPRSPELAELILPEKIQGIIRLLRTCYDYVIIDTPPHFNDITLTALELASTILFVTGLEISILKNSKLSLSLLESLKQTDKVKLIVNRAVSVSTITLDDVGKLINCPIWAKIPSDYKTAVTAVNRGIPFVTGAPKSDLSASISAITDLLLEGTEDIESLSPKKLKKLGLRSKRPEKKKINT